MKGQHFKYLIQCSILFFLVSCFDKVMILDSGTYRLIIQGEKANVPALIEVEDQQNFYLLRGNEKIKLDRLNRKHQKNDVIVLSMHIYNSELVLEAVENDVIKGYWLRKDKTPTQKIPLTMHYQKKTIFDDELKTPIYTLQGKWRWVFDPGTEKETKDLGLFTQNGNSIQGSIATPTGDYGLIQGIHSDKSIKMATFDGGFAFIVEANFQDENTISGNLLSLTSVRPFIAYRDESHGLPDATVATKALNSKSVKISLPSVYGSIVTLDDVKYKNKPVILQIYGSWCPNCLDEVKFLSEWYNQHRHEGLEVLAIAFERARSPEMAKNNIFKSIDKYKIPYDFVVAGVDNTVKPEDVLPIKNFISFPTTIFLDRTHKIVKIHAGFSGPATGEEYDKFKKFFYETVESFKK
jgi:thiol-disulfide isomerase/thioredoxin